MNTNKALAYGLLLLLLGGSTGYCLGLNRGLEQGTAISNVSISNPPHQTPETPVADGLKTFLDPTSGLTFRYPESIGTTYVSTVEWPPKLTTNDQAFACPTLDSEIPGKPKTEKRTINGQDFCVTTSSEGAAGSTYINYSYAFAEDSRTAMLAFTLRFVQCANYDEPQQSACKTEEEHDFNVDTLIQPIAASLKNK